MYLKRLELHGFKSFAQKTVLDFDPGMTAVVGPNGSGKSNITDALRWLLGEREARNLRGAKVEDLIFAGTKDRPRMGLAQATLYFDNSSGFFPVSAKEAFIDSTLLINPSFRLASQFLGFFIQNAFLKRLAGKPPQSLVY